MRTKTSTRRVARALELAPRPDPRAGLLETILVRDGEAQCVGAHVARLGTSARELYDIDLPEDLAARIAGVTADGRLRVILTPDGQATLEPAPLGAPNPHGRFAPFVLPGGLGRHKWADRRLNSALAHAAGEATALLVDTDGCVLEATWANLFIVEGDTVVTSPADGRLLPGTHRARIAATEEPFDLARLEAADEVFLTSALRRVGYRPSSSLYVRA